MGDRFLVGFKDTPKSQPVWLYSHWGGSERHEALAEALQAAQPRWGDGSYATRICISTIIGNDWSEETGFGISTGSEITMPDYSDIPVVTWGTRTIAIVDETALDKPLKTLTFSEFLERVNTRSLI